MNITTTRHGAVYPLLVTTVVSLNTRLPFAFGWLVVDAEWAMGIVRSAHGGKWGDFLHHSGAMTPGATERLMAAYLTWRGIPLPRSLQPLARRGRVRTAMLQWPG